MHVYNVMGLTLHSDIELPEFLPIDRSGLPDIRIALDERDFEALDDTADVYALRIDDVASYGVLNGRTIAIEPHRNASEKDIRIFLYATIWGVLCHQRGLLPLHASAVSYDEHMIAFAGDQGAGKSTIATLMSENGFDFANDDLTIIEAFPDRIRTWPFIRRSKLCVDVLDTLGAKRTEAETVHIASSKWWCEPRRRAQNDATQLRAVFVLEQGSDIEIKRLPFDQAATMLIEHTFRRHLLRGADQHRNHLSVCMRMARECPVYRLVRPFDLKKLPDVVHAVEEHLSVHASAS